MPMARASPWPASWLPAGSATSWASLLGFTSWASCSLAGAGEGAGDDSRRARSLRPNRRPARAASLAGLLSPQSRCRACRRLLRRHAARPGCQRGRDNFFSRSWWPQPRRSFAASCGFQFLPELGQTGLHEPPEIIHHGGPWSKDPVEGVWVAPHHRVPPRGRYRPFHSTLREGVPIETRGQVQACVIQLADVQEVNALGCLEVRVPELAEGIAAQALTALLFGLPGG